MKAEVQKIFKLYEELEEAGETATLTFSTRGGMSTVKLQLQASSSTAPSPSTSTPTLLPVPGKRRGHCSARARARLNQRAAAHHQWTTTSITTTTITTTPSLGNLLSATSFVVLWGLWKMWGTLHRPSWLLLRTRWRRLLWWRRRLRWLCSMTVRCLLTWTSWS